MQPMTSTEITLPSPAECGPVVSPAMRLEIVAYLADLDRTPPLGWHDAGMWEGDETRMMEVRLQIHDDGSWSIHTGDPQYDQDHRGHWADTVVPFEDDPDGQTFDAEETADTLIEGLE